MNIEAIITGLQEIAAVETGKGVRITEPRKTAVLEAIKELEARASNREMLEKAEKYRLQSVANVESSHKLLSATEDLQIVCKEILAGAELETEKNKVLLKKTGLGIAVQVGLLVVQIMFFIKTLGG